GDRYARSLTAARFAGISFVGATAPGAVGWERVMAHVSVSINGRQYRMACEDGQENHLVWLSGDLDRRIAELRKQFGEIGDMRLTMMAALTIADELVDIGKRLRRMED